MPLTSGPVQSAPQHGKRAIPQIQWLRAVAATAVILYHASYYQQTILHHDGFQKVFGPGLGYFGVGLFFAISGYLMASVVQVQPAMVFLAHRIIRIYPLYIIVAVVAHCLSRVLAPTLSFDFWVLPLAPLARIGYTNLHVEWTLIFEIAFYACLFLVSWLGKASRVSWIALAWLAVIACGSLMAPTSADRVLLPFWQLLTVSACIPMAAGLLLPRFLRADVPWWLPLALSAAFCFVAIRFSHSNDGYRWFYGLGSFCLLWGMLAIPPASRLLRWGWWGRVFARYGDYSYALYLWHVPLIYIVYCNAGTLSPWLGWAIAVGSSIGMAVIFGRLDVALYERSKTWMRRLEPIRLRRATVAWFGIYAILSVQGSIEYHLRDREDRIEHALVQTLLSSGLDTDAATAQVRLAKLGFTTGEGLGGLVEEQYWDSKQGRLFVELWAFDARSGKHLPHVALVRNGSVLHIASPSYVRQDVQETLHLSRRVKTGYHFDQTEGCDPHPVTAIAFTDDKRYLVLPNSTNSPSCASIGQGAP